MAYIIELWTPPALNKDTGQLNWSGTYKILTLPTPSEVNLSHYDLSIESERTANGLLVRQYVATKRKLEVRWSYIRDDDLKPLVNAINNSANKFFGVKYMEVGATGNNTNSSMLAYVGDRQWSPFRVIDGVRWWRDVRIALIEV